MSRRDAIIAVLLSELLSRLLHIPSLGEVIASVLEIVHDALREAGVFSIAFDPAFEAAIFGIDLRKLALLLTVIILLLGLLIGKSDASH